MSEITLYRDGENQGPFTLEQVKAFVIIGRASVSDFAWYPGLADWIPLGSAILNLEKNESSESEDWRRKIATADQKAEMRFLGHKLKREITQGECDDVIKKACEDPGIASGLEHFRLYRAKEREFSDYINITPSLEMMPPTKEKLRETMAFLDDNVPNWMAETTPAEFAALILSRYPELKIEQFIADHMEDSDDPEDVPPATAAQIAFLERLGATFPDDINIADASALIDKFVNRASDAQKRRLNFYGLDYDPEISKTQASTLIDCYQHKHPESEDAYQEWKVDNNIV